MEKRSRGEVVELHKFFQEWFNGSLPLTEESFARVVEALSKDFIIITPQGRLVDRVTLLTGLYKGHNSRKDLHIWIKNFRLHYQQGNILLAIYEEWQEAAGETTARLSTVVFRERTGGPNGLEWLHVHETWLETGRPEED